MNDCNIQDGTWMSRVPTCKRGVWRTIIFEPWVTDSRFRRARFVLVGGPTVSVSADELRHVVTTTEVRGKIACPLRIAPRKSTINDQPVELQTVT